MRLPRLLKGDLTEECRLHPTKQSATINLTSLSTASLTLDESEPAVPVRAWVELYRGDDSIGIYRCTSPQIQYGNEQTVALEHGITSLGDELTDEGTDGAEIKITGTPLYILQALLGYQVTEMWQAGTAPNTGSYTISVTLSNVLSAVFDLCAKVYGYAYSYDFTTTPWTLNMVALESAPSCECRLSRNMSGVRISMDDNDLCTRVRSSKLSGGQMTADTASTWGIVSKALTIDAAATTEEATAYATAYLAEYKNPRVSAEITAIDLSDISGEPADTFAIGKLCRVALPDYNTTVEQRIVAVAYDDALNAPESCKLTLSTIPRNITLTVAALNKKIIGTSGTRGGGGVSGKSEPEILHTAIWQNKEDIQLRAWASDMSAAQAAIIVNAEQILLRVSKDGVISSINQSAEAIQITATRIDLTGYVTASQLSAALASVDSMIIGTLAVNSVGGSGATFGTLNATQTLIYQSETISKASKTVMTNVTAGLTKTLINDTWVVTDVNLTKSTSSMSYLSY